MFEIVCAIFRRVSSLLGCTKCLKEVRSERIVVSEETCNKTNSDNENDEEHVNMPELPKFVIFRLPNENATQDSIATIVQNCYQQLEVEKMDNGSNMKAPIKPPRKKLQIEENKRVFIDNLSSETSRTNCYPNRLTNDCLCDITDRQIMYPSEKMEVPAITATAEGCSDFLLASSKPQNISKQFLTSSIRSPRQSSQEHLINVSSFMKMPTPSKRIIHHGPNINKQKDMSTSTKIDLKNDIKKLSFRIKLRKYSLLFLRQTPKERRNE